MILFYFLITQMPLDQDPTWGKFLGAATLIKYLGLACVFYAILYLVTRHSAPRYLATIQARLFMVFLLLTFCSYWLMGPAFSIRTSPFISYLSMAFLFFVVLSTVDTLSRLRWTLLAAVGSMGWASLFVVREWMRDPMWRPGSIAGDANYFALDTCLVLPVAFLLVWRSRVLWERDFCPRLPSGNHRSQYAWCVPRGFLRPWSSVPLASVAFASSASQLHFYTRPGYPPSFVASVLSPPSFVHPKTSDITGERSTGLSPGRQGCGWWSNTLDGYWARRVQAANDTVCRSGRRLFVDCP